MEKLTGLIAAPFTPLKDDGELNLGQIKPLAELYKKNGVGGAFICGSTGEGSSLTHQEKKEVMKSWALEKSEELKLIFLLGGTCLKEMQELAVLAQEYKMDGISALSPYYFRPKSVTELVHFCQEVAQSAPSLPFYYYHIPSMTHGNFSMFEFLKHADGVIPNLAGIKYTHSDLFDFQACVAFKGRKYNMLWGTDEALISGMIAGADGAVGSTYNYAAPLYSRLLVAYNNGQIETAQTLQMKAVEMVKLLKKYGGTNAGKGFMKLIGVNCGWFRSPLFPLTENQLSGLKSDLENSGFFDYCSKR